MVKNPPANAGNIGLISASGTKVLHTTEQLESLCATTRERPCATTKTQHSQNLKKLIFKNLICHPGILAMWQDMPLAYVQTHSAQVQ